MSPIQPEVHALVKTSQPPAQRPSYLFLFIWFSFLVRSVHTHQHQGDHCGVSLLVIDDKRDPPPPARKTRGMSPSQHDEKRKEKGVKFPPG
jgi:hypothetical protein